ncbi:DUF4142 domain-containing protein [Desertivirga brevis]|uniref:DUF4142 domain-containing protein n=1 Tax=Desertivirga brevis TaxID=2810310 RepID=UPI001A96F8D4|nr:DUF4142 domain-containing protein [Pedobacter sp. SYSU D00873]
MKTFRIIGLILIGACTIQACDKDDIDEGDETEFVSKAASSNMFEIESGKLAASAAKGARAEVKNYGNMMIADHTAATIELQAVAEQNGIAMPTSMNEEHRAMYNDLNARSGADFDRVYAQMMVDSHQRTVNLFEEAADDLDDPEIKKFAQDKIPVLKMHLDHAVTLKNTVNP